MAKKRITKREVLQNIPQSKEKLLGVDEIVAKVSKKGGK
jgi:hypothetical protein